MMHASPVIARDRFAKIIHAADRRSPFRRPLPNDDAPVMKESSELERLKDKYRNSSVITAEMRFLLGRNNKEGDHDGNTEDAPDGR